MCPTTKARILGTLFISMCLTAEALNLGTYAASFADAANTFVLHDTHSQHDTSANTSAKHSIQVNAQAFLQARNHEKRADNVDTVLWHGPFDQHMTLDKSEGAEVKVAQRGRMRTLTFVPPGFTGETYSTLNCGVLDIGKATTCEEQPCDTSDVQPEELGLFKNYKSIVSIGPTALGSELKRVAVIGVGGGSMVHFLHKMLPELAIDAVEYSATMAKAAVSCFAFPSSQQVQLHIQDGVSFLEATKENVYDWIIVDASGSQDRFNTPEAHKQYSRVLRQNGIVTYNMAGQETFPELVKLGVERVKPLWKHVYTTHDYAAISVTNGDLLAAPVSKNTIKAHSNFLQNPISDKWQRAAVKWFGKGLLELERREMALGH